MTTQTFSVVGMTCDHCIAAVTQEVSQVPGVREVTVDLVPGATSTVTITSDLPLSEDDVRAAVDEAGYDLAG